MTLRLQQYIDNKLPSVPRLKLTYPDLLRVSKQIKQNIFSNKCVIVENSNFVLNNMKYTLSRILYINFKGPLNDREHVRRLCKTKGCVTLKHLYKVTRKQEIKEKPPPPNLSVKIVYKTDIPDKRLSIS